MPQGKPEVEQCIKGLMAHLAATKRCIEISFGEKTRRLQQNHAYFNKTQYPGQWVASNHPLGAPSFIDTICVQELFGATLWPTQHAPIKSQISSLWPSQKNADFRTNQHILAKTRRLQQNHAYFNKIQYPGQWVASNHPLETQNFTIH